MKKILILALCALSFFVGTVLAEPIDDVRPSPPNAIIHINTVGMPGVPLEWWDDDGGGGVVWLGTSPGFRVFLNGVEQFPLPCPVQGGCILPSAKYDEVFNNR